MTHHPVEPRQQLATVSSEIWKVVEGHTIDERHARKESLECPSV